MPQGIGFFFPLMKYKPFQKEDFARMAITPGCIVGLDRGLGKSLCAYTLAALKVGFRKDVRGLHPLEPVALVVPPGLHDQMIDEGEQHFKVRPKRLYTKEDFYRLSTVNSKTGKRELQPGFYITSYSALAVVGVRPFPELTGGTAHMMEELHLNESHVVDWFNDRGTRYAKQYGTLECTPSDTLAQIRAKYFRLRKAHTNEDVRLELDSAWNILSNVTGMGQSYGSLTTEQKCFIRWEVIKARYLEYKAEIAEARWYSWGKVKCVYSPSLADESQDSFGVMVVDESVKMKGEDTFVGKGTRQMNPRYRYAMTGTPIKNRLPDIFRLAWWVAGGKEDPHGRFPYGDSAEARGDFASEFLISERNLSKEEEQNRRYKKLTPQVCNIHRLWKILPPLVLRRRKEDCGEQIVPKIRHIVRVPMGKKQAEVYKYHLAAKYKDVNKKPAVGARLTALRITAANPASALLERPPGDDTEGPPSSPYDYTPKVSAQLRLILAALQRKEQIVLFSAFLDALDTVAARLAESGVAHLVLDGRVPPAKRGRLAKEFKRGPARSAYPVMFASEECMAEGYSFDLANNVARSSYSWALDRGLQAVDRVHRLTSIKPVNVYGVLCDGTIDRKLEGMQDEKSDAADLVLDGKLFGDNPTEINLAELLEIARAEFDPKQETIDERELEKEWPLLRAQLAAAFRVWNEPDNVIALPTVVPKEDMTVDLEFADLPLWQMVT